MQVLCRQIRWLLGVNRQLPLAMEFFQILNDHGDVLSMHIVSEYSFDDGALRVLDISRMRPTDRTKCS